MSASQIIQDNVTRWKCWLQKWTPLVTNLDRNQHLKKMCLVILKFVIDQHGVTSESSAEEAVPRFSGSTESKVSKRLTAILGNSSHLSLRVLSYGCWGLNIVARGSLDFFQYSSDGVPQSLKIICSCSTWRCLINYFTNNKAVHYMLLVIKSVCSENL